MQQPENPQRDAIMKQMRQALEEGGTEPKADPIRQFKDGDKWKCIACGRDTFGVVVGGTLQVKYRERSFEVSAPEGRIRVNCRRCATLNVLNMNNISVQIQQISPPDATEKAIELAQENNVDLFAIEGTGQDGKVQVNDIRRYLKQRQDDHDAKVVSTQTFETKPIGSDGIPATGVQQPEEVPGEMDDGFIEIDSGD